jgi:hypothetical protein
MVIDFIGVLVKPSKGIDLIVAAISNRGVDEASRSLAESPCDPRPIPVHHSPIL